MLARIVSLLLLSFTVNSLHAFQLAKSGSIKLKINTEDLESHTIKLATNDNKILGNLRLYHTHIYDDFCYKDVIKGEFVFDNLDAKHANFQYQLIFKDKKGLVAKTVGHISLPQGKNQAIACSNIPLSIQDINSISLYEIKLMALK